MRSRIVLMALLALAFAVQASPVSERQARLAARAWARSGSRLGARLGTSVEGSRQFATADGASFFTVKMRGGGTIFLSGDSDEEPIVAMTAANAAEPEVGSPLRDLLERDLAARAAARRSASTAIAEDAKKKARARWLRLVRAGEALEGAGGGKEPASSVEPSDLRVPKLLGSQWDQSGHGENYYTPNHYICGCVATAMAQVMRYYSYPVAEVQPFSNKDCEVDGVKTKKEALGGVYDWENMPLLPTFGMAETNKQCIGRLTYDCGVAVGMSWSEDWSGAFEWKVADALKNRFGYASAECSTDKLSLSTDEKYREKVIYASLDAGFPVQFGIYNSGVDGSGHAVVGDGYGYIDGVSYVHINMGWSGQGDIWYHLPDITYVAKSGGTVYEANIVDTCIYNVFPTATGVVLSGRTVDDEGAIVTNAAVSVFRAGESVPFTNLTSSAYGVYGVVLDPNADYVVAATIATEYGVFSGESEVSVGDENFWGLEVELSNPSVRVISADGATTNVFSSLNKALDGAASFDSPTVEVFAPTLLRRSVVVTNSCRIAAAPEAGGSAFVKRLDNEGFAVITIDGSTNVFENIIFSSATDAPVRAVNGGVIAFAGLTSKSETLSVSADAPGGFALADEIDGGVQVYVEDAMTNGAVFGFAICPFATASANAAKILNPMNLALVGEAFVDSDTGEVLLRWSEGDVDPSAASVKYMDNSGAWHYCRSVDDAFALDATNIVIQKSGRITKVFCPTNDVVITSENDAVLSAAAQAQIKVETGVSVAFKDVEINGFNGVDAFLVVAGGTATLGSGAMFENLVNNNSADRNDTYLCYGPIVVKSGKLVMLSGSVINGCRAECSNSVSEGGRGGGVYVYPNAEFEMQGGTVTNCYAEAGGGGVYADRKATIRLSGDATIAGNTTSVEKGDVEDDLRRTPSATIYVSGPMTGSVGISGTDVSSTTNGAQFVTADVGVSAADLATSLTSFFCTAGGEVRKAKLSVSGDALEWEVEEVVEGPVEVAPLYDDGGHVTNAVARVIYGDGTTNYWETVENAFGSLHSASAEVEMLVDDFFVGDIVVTNSVTLRTAADYVGSPSGMALIERADQCSVVVQGSGSLTVEGVEFSGMCEDPLSGDIIGFGNCRLFDVKGGTLRLDGAVVRDVYGETDRAAAAVVVYSAGRLEVDGGSVISYCENYFVNEDENSGVAGGVVVEGEGTVAVLRDCVISDCYSRKTGGVFIGNKATVFISGDANVYGNASFDENSNGNMVVAAGGSLVMDGELTGRIGYSEGISGDTNVFGVATFGAGDTAAAASVTNFVHDRTHARAELSGTNLVWNLAGRMPVAIPALEAEVFAYDSNVHTALVAGAGYVFAVDAFGDTNAYGAHAGLYRVVVRPDDGCVWDDGSSDAKSFSWEITPASLAVVADDANKTEGEDDPEFTYTVSGLVGSDDADSVIEVVLEREKGEDPGTYAITLKRHEMLSGNYSFDPQAAFTAGVFTIEASESELLPEMPDGASKDDILSALEDAGVTDPDIVAAVSAYYDEDPAAAVAAYNAFSKWASETTGGKEAVCASKKAWVSYEFGASELFENTPTVTFTAMAIENPAEASMRVTLVVKDGDAEKTVSPESVAKLFVVSADFKNWTDELTVSLNDDGSYTVKPNDPTLKAAFIRLVY